MANYGKYYIAVRLLLPKQPLKQNQIQYWMASGQKKTPDPIVGIRSFRAASQICCRSFLAGKLRKERLGQALAGNAHPRCS